MRRTKRLMTMFSFIAVLGAFETQAGSSSVGLAITFEVAPLDLIRSRNVAPSEVRSCEALKARVDAAWAGKSRVPSLGCATHRKMPLIVTDASGDTLVVRP